MQMQRGAHEGPTSCSLPACHACQGDWQGSAGTFNFTHQNCMTSSFFSVFTLIVQLSAG